MKSFLIAIMCMLAGIALALPSRARVPFHRFQLQPARFRDLDGSVVWLLIVLAFGIAFRIHYFLGFGMGDDRDYMNVIRQLMEGQHVVTRDGVFFSPFRVGYLAPIALIFNLFGVSEVNLVLFNFLSGVTLIVLAYVLGRFLLGPVTGVLAAYLVALNPLSVLSSSVLFNDATIAATNAAGVLLFLVAVNREKFGLVFASAVCIFWAYLVKPLGPWVAVPLVLGTLVLYPSRWKTVLLFATILLGVLLVLFLGECFYYWIRTGDFLLRLHKGQFFYHNLLFGDFHPSRIPSMMRYYPEQMWRLPLVQNEYGITFFLLPISMIALVLLRRHVEWRPILFVLMWAALMFCFLQFGSMSLTRYLPMHRLTRLLEALTVPVAILIAAGAVRAIAFLPRGRTIGYFLIAAVAGMISLVSLQFQYHQMRDIEKFDIDEVKQFMRSRHPARIRALHWMSGILDLETAYGKKADFRTIGGDPAEAEPGSYVVVGGVPAFANSDGYMNDPAYAGLMNPPRNWRLVHLAEGPKYWGRSGPVKIYFVE